MSAIRGVQVKCDEVYKSTRRSIFAQNNEEVCRLCRSYKVYHIAIRYIIC